MPEQREILLKVYLGEIREERRLGADGNVREHGQGTKNITLASQDRSPGLKERHGGTRGDAKSRGELGPATDREGSQLVFCYECFELGRENADLVDLLLAQCRDRERGFNFLPHRGDPLRGNLDVENLCEFEVIDHGARGAVKIRLVDVEVEKPVCSISSNADVRLGKCMLYAKGIDPCLVDRCPDDDVIVLHATFVQVRRIEINAANRVQPDFSTIIWKFIETP